MRQHTQHLIQTRQQATKLLNCCCSKGGSVNGGKSPNVSHCFLHFVNFNNNNRSSHSSQNSLNVIYLGEEYSKQGKSMNFAISRRETREQQIILEINLIYRNTAECGFFSACLTHSLNVWLQLCQKAIKVMELYHHESTENPEKIGIVIQARHTHLKNALQLFSIMWSPQ